MKAKIIKATAGMGLIGFVGWQILTIGTLKGRLDEAEGGLSEAIYEADWRGSQLDKLEKSLEGSTDAYGEKRDNIADIVASCEELAARINSNSSRISDAESGIGEILDSLQKINKAIEGTPAYGGIDGLTRKVRDIEMDLERLRLDR